jgi:hypothetical protein
VARDLQPGGFLQLEDLGRAQLEESTLVGELDIPAVPRKERGTELVLDPRDGLA